MAGKLRLLVAGGGTGGHLYPGIALAEALSERVPLEARFVGTKRGVETRVLPPLGYRLYLLSIGGLYRVGWVKKGLNLLKLPLALFQALWILLSYRPHLVLGVGGYASGPMLLMALLFGFRTALQEQNAAPGMTNRFLGPLVPISFVPFAGLEQQFKNPLALGNPLRKELLQAREVKVKRAASPFTIAIIGGTQGARALNEAVLAMLPLLPQTGVRLIHQTGAANLAKIQEGYKPYPHLHAEVVPFIHEMSKLYQSCHLLISRAGSVVHELTAMGRASILIPIPLSSGDHQRKNAQKLAEAGAAILLEQADLKGEKLFALVQGLMQDPERLKSMEQASAGLFAGDAAASMAGALLEFYDFKSL